MAPWGSHSIGASTGGDETKAGVAPGFLSDVPWRLQQQQRGVLLSWGPLPAWGGLGVGARMSCWWYVTRLFAAEPWPSFPSTATPLPLSLWQSSSECLLQACQRLQHRPAGCQRWRCHQHGRTGQCGQRDPVSCLREVKVAAWRGLVLVEGVVVPGKGR